METRPFEARTKALARMSPSRSRCNVTARRDRDFVQPFQAAFWPFVHNLTMKAEAPTRHPSPNRPPACPSPDLPLPFSLFLVPGICKDPSCSQRSGRHQVRLSPCCFSLLLPSIKIGPAAERRQRHLVNLYFLLVPTRHDLADGCGQVRKIPSEKLNKSENNANSGNFFVGYSARQQ